MCEKNNVQKHIFRKIFRKHEKSSEAKCLEALIYLGGAYWFRTSDLLNVSQALSR